MNAEAEQPDFLSQTGGVQSDDDASVWFQERYREAKAQGATWCRYSRHPEQDGLLLFEGWKVWPSDEGEPRWQFAAPRETEG
jgi:hypothetical protein